MSESEKASSSAASASGGNSGVHNGTSDSSRPSLQRFEDPFPSSQTGFSLHHSNNVSDVPPSMPSQLQYQYINNAIWPGHGQTPSAALTLAMMTLPIQTREVWNDFNRMSQGSMINQAMQEAPNQSKPLVSTELHLFESTMAPSAQGRHTVAAMPTLHQGRIPNTGDLRAMALPAHQEQLLVPSDMHPLHSADGLNARRYHDTESTSVLRPIITSHAEPLSATTLLTNHGYGQMLGSHSNDRLDLADNSASLSALRYQGDQNRLGSESVSTFNSSASYGIAPMLGPENKKADSEALCQHSAISAAPRLSKGNIMNSSVTHGTTSFRPMVGLQNHHRSGLADNSASLISQEEQNRIYSEAVLAFSSSASRSIAPMLGPDNKKADSEAPCQKSATSAAMPKLNQGSMMDSSIIYETANLPSLVGSGVSQVSNNHNIVTSGIQDGRNQTGPGNTRGLLIQSASTLLDPVHQFLQLECIEVFTTTEDDMTASGRGARPSKLGQIGLRCFFCRTVPKKHLAKQAVCFPSKKTNIFEGVRNYQRTHLHACICIPEEIKARYKALIEEGFPQRVSHKYLKAYYAEAASELGIIETSKGLVFGSEPNTSGVPSATMQGLVEAAANPAKSSAFWKDYSSGKKGKDKVAEMRKFEHLASDDTKRVIVNAKREPTPFVRPEDFPSISDFEFLLFHQVAPCPLRQHSAVLQHTALDAVDGTSQLFGFCCKHCDRAGELMDNHKWYFSVADSSSFAETSFLQRMTSHFIKCPNVPQEVKNAFDELKRLASDHDTTAKRGPRKRFIGKITERMKSYYRLKSDL